MSMDPFRWGPMAGPYLTPQGLGYPFAPQQPWWDAWQNPLASAAAAGLAPLQAPPWMMGTALGQPGMQMAGLSPFANGPALPDPNVEVQAMTGFLQDASSGAIRKLFDYFSTNGERYPQLGNGLALLNQAVESFRARDYARAFAQVYDVYRYVTAVRAATPDIPAIA
jgi:hypothetical protein